MRHVSCLVLCAVCAVGMTARSAEAQSNCDRACLRETLDRYLSAVVAHDPARASLVVGFRQTENGINPRPGDGVWKTVTALGKMQRRYLDATSGQAGYYGLVEEGSSVALATGGLRGQNRKVTEAEGYTPAPAAPGLNGPRQPGPPPANLLNTDYLIANPPPERV